MITKNREFGSDFHFTDSIPILESIPTEKWRDGVMYADGRQAINALIEHNGWKRIWIPTYFCYDVIQYIAQTGIEIVFYDDYPTADDDAIISELAFRQTDVLLRMNYFGLRGWRDNSKLNVTVIEDHSHALSGEWVNGSNADWCIASLRKTLPISEGGVLWSPKGLVLPPAPAQTSENIELSALRTEAMNLKQQYRTGEIIDKEAFRSIFIETEKKFVSLPVSAIADSDYKIISSMNVEKWNNFKKRNWEILNRTFSNELEILQPENSSCIPFSFVFKGQRYREKLIANRIYPAVLWQVPEKYNMDLLSIHCDGRYTENDMKAMIYIIRLCLK